MSTQQKQKPAPAMPPVNSVLNNAQVAFALAISVRKLQEMVSAGEFPACDFRIGDSPRWRVKTFDAWVEAQATKGKG